MFSMRSLQNTNIYFKSDKSTCLQTNLTYILLNYLVKMLVCTGLKFVSVNYGVNVLVGMELSFTQY